MKLEHLPCAHTYGPDLQYDSRTPAAGRSTARQPQASVVASGDYSGERAFRQPGGPAVHSSLRAGNRSVHLSVPHQEKQDSSSLFSRRQKCAQKACTVNVQIAYSIVSYRRRSCDHNSK